jgi:hypothetical protein
LKGIVLGDSKSLVGEIDFILANNSDQIKVLSLNMTLMAQINLTMQNGTIYP